MINEYKANYLPSKSHKQTLSGQECHGCETYGTQCRHGCKGQIIGSHTVRVVHWQICGHQLVFGSLLVVSEGARIVLRQLGHLFVLAINLDCRYHGAFLCCLEVVDGQSLVREIYPFSARLASTVFTLWLLMGWLCLCLLVSWE